METLKKTLGLSLLLIIFLLSIQVQGQKKGNNGNRKVKNERSHNNDRVGNNHNRNSRYRTQPIHRNPSYRYPNRRRVVRTLPRHHVTLMYGGLSYFYYSGIYYSLYGEEYIVVMPPRGFRIHVLPVGYVRIVVGPSIYFYHSGVYYSESAVSTTEADGKYEVTKAPVGVVLNDISEDSEEIVIDGKIFYEYNDVLYKKVINSEGIASYKVVYSKQNED